MSTVDSNGICNEGYQQLTGQDLSEESHKGLSIMTRWMKKSPVDANGICNEGNQQERTPLKTEDTSSVQAETSFSRWSIMTRWMKMKMKKKCHIVVAVVITALITALIASIIFVFIVPKTKDFDEATSPQHSDNEKLHKVTIINTPQQRICESEIKKIEKHDPNELFQCDGNVEEDIRNATCLFSEGSCNTCEEALEKNLTRNPIAFVQCCTRKTFCNMGKYCGEGHLECKINNPIPHCEGCPPGFNGTKCQSELSPATVQCKCYQLGVDNERKELCNNTYFGGEKQECRLGNCLCDLRNETKPGSYEMCDGTF